MASKVVEYSRRQATGPQVLLPPSNEHAHIDECRVAGALWGKEGLAPSAYPYLPKVGRYLRYLLSRWPHVSRLKLTSA